MRKSTIRRYSLIAIALTSLSLVACKDEVAPQEVQIRPIKAIQVAAQVDMDTRTFPGVAKATQEVNLSFRVGGPLITFPVNIGDRVKEGDVLARIDPRDFEIDVDNAQGKLNKAQANAKRAQADYDRELNILKQDAGATSQAAVDRKEDQRDQAYADIKSLKASVDAAKDKLRYTYLKAPYDGIVVDTIVENFETVLPRQQIVRVLDDSWIEMVVNIPEDLISKVSKLAKISVRFDAYPQHAFEAKVKEIGTEASKITRTYPVNLIMEQAEDITILPGMAGTATGSSEKENVEKKLLIPIQSVFTPDTEKQDHVWVIDEKSGKVSLRKITVGHMTTAGIQVVDGLQAGEWIAVAGVHTLHDGQTVRINSRVIAE